MTTVTYLLHRFPRVTDTFIMREINSLVRSGLNVNVISVWKPQEQETTDSLLTAWSSRVTFLLPGSVGSIAKLLAVEICRNPIRFLSTLHKAMRTARPGLRGFGYQMFYLAEALLAAKHIRSSTCDHLHNHFGDQSGTVTMLAAILTGIGYSISFHGPHIFFDAANSSLKEKIEGASFTRSISYFCRSQLMIFAGSTAIRSEIIHCGLDLDNYQFRNPKHKVDIIFCAARLAPEKGFEFLLEAFKLVLAHHDQIRLRIAGDGSSKVSLQAKALDLGISDRVEFLGQLAETQVTNELRNSDLFVLPSLAEGVPVSLMEAMAVGVPVIATNIAGVSELVEDGVSGFLVPPTDAKTLAATILRIVSDHDLRIQAAENGRRKIADEFDIDVETAKLGRLFRAVERSN
jgi:colanic acid/amylovoran biosynthesis glycosyltransferase